MSEVQKGNGGFYVSRFLDDQMNANRLADGLTKEQVAQEIIRDMAKRPWYVVKRTRIEYHRDERYLNWEVRVYFDGYEDESFTPVAEIV